MNVKTVVKVLVLAAFCFILLQNCKKSDIDPWEDIEYKVIAWNALTKAEQASVDGNWRSGKVEMTKYWETNQDAVSVTFHTVVDNFLGPIVVYIDPETKQVIGFGLRL